jgi:hypothetical protein
MRTVACRSTRSDPKRYRRSSLKFPDCFEELLARTQWNAQLLEVPVRQLGENLVVDLLLSEDRGELAEVKLPVREGELPVFAPVQYAGYRSGSI